jgi:hypothetical protein
MASRDGLLVKPACSLNGSIDPDCVEARMASRYARSWTMAIASVRWRPCFTAGLYDRQGDDVADDTGSR